MAWWHEAVAPWEKRTVVTAPDLSRRTLLGNISALFGAQGLAMVVPLLTVPYLARTLRPSGWAAVLVAQALGNWLILLVEYGFDLSGTRAIAQARSTPGRLPAVIAGVHGAKLMLVPVAAAIMAALFVLLPTLQGDVRLFLWTFAFACFRGLSPLWYFQGVERMRAAVGIDAGARAAAALGVFVTVRTPEDGWRVLALQACFAALSLCILLLLVRRDVPLRLPRFGGALSTLRRSAGVFALRAASGLSIQANTLLLAVLATPATVSYFGGAERIVRASINLLQPLTQAFLPRLSYLSVADPPAARRLIGRCLLAVGGLGAVFSVVALLGATRLIAVLLGPGYEAAVPPMRTLAALPLLVAVNTVLGLYWAIPFGHERTFVLIVLAGGAANVVLALLLVPLLGALGMAAAVVAAEAIVTVSLATLFLARQEHTATRPVLAAES